ncbi:EspA/EspE family type VII secretion system effector [Mycobacterium sp. Aquia_213]|uniref:EspA/EspE family type VII secretion system effector n=1 Tax=Mycobacterium sp. Aquia_213 TaxID=2991728 RepID=UPI002270F35D|nr:EspA/EspE family type VII secretion system effector [Mycobacterium sp. Aquia_213]WAC93238.1 EspA/EspE family type VII secretion system effector [Mycobacterium sp. Aquia_213]
MPRDSREIGRKLAMPKISDTWKPGFSTVAAGKAFATGNYADGTLNLVLALGQAGYAIGKNYLPKSVAGDLLGPRKEGKESLRDSFGVEAVILERGIQIVTALTLLLGSGKEQGQTYEAASSYFKLAWENLKDAAVVGDSWLGTAADSYNALNAQQTEWATIMEGLDLQVAALLQQNSDTLGNCKITLTSVRAFYTACIPVAATLRWAYGPAGEAISITFQWAMLLVGLPVALSACVVAFTKAADNGAALQAVTAEYTAVAASATGTGSEYAPPAEAPAPKSTVSEFDEINAGSSAAASGGFGQGAALPAGTPSSSPGAVSTGEAESPSGDWSGAPSLEGAVPQAGGSPAYASPAVGRMPSAVSGAPTSSPSPAAAGAKGTAAHEPTADEEGVLEGAATGAEAAERAPVGTPADGTESVHERVR